MESRGLDKLKMNKIQKKTSQHGLWYVFWITVQTKVIVLYTSNIAIVALTP